MALFKKKQASASAGAVSKHTVQVIAAGRAPVEVEGEDEWSVEDYLIQAGVDADKVTVDGKDAKLSDKVGAEAKKIVAIPNVKGGL